MPTEDNNVGQVPGGSGGVTPISVVHSDFKALLDSAIRETGAELDSSTDELAMYAAQRTAYLAGIVGEPGFDEALKAERDNVALKAGLIVTARAGATDARIVGIIQGALSLGARALVGAV